MSQIESFKSVDAKGGMLQLFVLRHCNIDKVAYTQNSIIKIQKKNTKVNTLSLPKYIN